MFDGFNNSLARLLYSISNLLLYPVLATIVCLAGVVLLWSGGFFREWLGRSHVRNGLRETMSQLRDGKPEAELVWARLSAIAEGLPRKLTLEYAHPPVNPRSAELALNDLESAIADRLAKCHFVTRAGPMFGLLGTLIPFGPALTGLAAGDIQELSVNLVTAFATTVVGLLCGCVTFGIGLTRRSWYSRDFDDIEFIVQSIAEV